MGAETRDSISDDHIINNIIDAADQVQGNYCCRAVVFYNSSTNSQIRELVVPDNDSFSLTSSPAEVATGNAVDGGVLTLSAWIRPESDEAYWGIIQKWNLGHILCDSPADAPRREWAFYINNNRQPEFTVCDESSNAVKGIRATGTGVVVVQGKWMHVAVTYDGRGGHSSNSHTPIAGMKMYINGQEVATTTALQEVAGNYASAENFAYPVEIGTLSIGGDTNAGGTCSPNAGNRYGFHGQIAQVAIWRKALVADEIEKVYKHKDLRVIDHVTGGDVELPLAFWRMGNGTYRHTDGVLYHDAIDGTGNTGTSNYGKNYIFDQIGTHHAYARDGWGNDDDSSNRSNTFPDDAIMPVNVDGLVNTNYAGAGPHVASTFPNPTLKSMGRSVPMKFPVRGPQNNRASNKIYKVFIGDTENTNNF